MFGRFGWAEILIIVVLVLILFSHNKIPAMMKNVADGLKVFKKELKSEPAPAAKSTAKSTAARRAPAKPAAKKTVKKNETKTPAYIEFGAYASMAGANTAMRRILGAHADVIGDNEFVILEEGTRPAFKLRIAFDTMADARAFVADANAAGVKCHIVA